MSAYDYDLFVIGAGHVGCQLGKIAPDARQSIPHWPEMPKAPKGAPNIVLILLDDIGFGQLSGTSFDNNVSIDSSNAFPLAGCEALAKGAHAPYVSLGPVGHVCALEGPDAVNALLK